MKYGIIFGLTDSYSKKDLSSKKGYTFDFWV